MKPEQRTDVRDSVQSRHGGAGNAGSTLVLDGEMTWKAAQISPEDAELLETRKFGVIELCRLFQVPPPIVQAYENNTFTNAAQAGLWFATFCLAPWARKIEAEFRSEEHTSELQSLMRNSYAVFCLKKKTRNNGDK